MLLELFPFVTLNNAMGHDGFYILISFSLLIITVRGVSNKHCLLPFFIIFEQQLLLRVDSLSVTSNVRV